MVGALAFVAFGTPLYAQVPVVTEVAKEEVKEELAFSGAATLNLRSSTTNPEDSNYIVLLNPRLSLNYKFEDLFTLGFDLRGNKDLNNEQRSTLTAASLSVSRSFEYSDAIGFGASAYYGAPVSKDLIKYSNSKGTIGAGGSADYTFDGVLSGLSLSASLYYERYLYQYEYANGGSILTKYGWTQTYGLSYTYEQLTLATSFSNVSTWDFEGEKENDSYLWVETISYKFNDIWSAHVGHINDGSTYDYLGASNNVRFYDKRRSQVYVGTSYRF